MRNPSRRAQWIGLPHVQVLDLARCADYRRPTLHLQQTRIPPEEPHHALCPGPSTDRVQERGGHRLAVEWANRRVHEEPDSRLTLVSLLLRELVVRGRPTEPGRQYLLQDADHVRIQKRHPSRGEFFEAPDGV